MNPIYYVLAAGLFAGAFQVARKTISSQGLSPLLGATIFSLSAGLFGLLLLLKEKQNLINLNSKSLLFAFLAGLLVLPIDYFILKAYEKGYPIALGSVILVGLSAAIAVLAGVFWLNESLRPLKALGICLILIGIIFIKYSK